MNPEHTHSKARLFPCFLCGVGLDVRYSSRSKPYLVCDSCGVQIFVRGKKGISLLEQALAAFSGKGKAQPPIFDLRISTLAQRISQLRESLDQIEERRGLLEGILLGGSSATEESLRAAIEALEAELQELLKKT